MTSISDTNPFKKGLQFKLKDLCLLSYYPHWSDCYSLSSLDIFITHHIRA